MKNLIFDGKQYYLVRSLNSGNIADRKKGIMDIRVDALRYQEKNAENGKYPIDGEVSLREVWDHIKEHHSYDTNCTSLTGNANVALTYYPEIQKYVLIPVTKEELKSDSPIFEAGPYMQAEIEKRIKEIIDSLEDEKRDFFRGIDEARSIQEVMQILRDKRN